jgi:hypothetical protein
LIYIKQAFGGTRRVSPLNGGTAMKKISLRKLVRVTATASSFVILSAAASPGARADDSVALLKAMADYTAAQKSISATFDSDIEVVTPGLQKI